MKEKIQKYKNFFKNLNGKQIFQLLFWPALLSFVVMFLVGYLFDLLKLYEEIYYLPGIIISGLVGGLICFYITHQVTKNCFLSIFAFFFWGYMSLQGWMWIILFFSCALAGDCI